MSKLLIMIIISFGLSSNRVFTPFCGSHEIPITIYWNIIFIELEVNDRPAMFIVDTGASVSLVDRQQASEYEFICHENVGSGKINGLTGINTLVPTSRINVSHYNYKFRGIKFYAIDIDPIHEYLEKRNIHILGILGADFLIKNKAVIDYENKILILNR